LNIEKANIAKSSTNYFQEDAIQITHQNKPIKSMESAKFLGFKIDNHELEKAY
jgi:hypothetical protein